MLDLEKIALLVLKIADANYIHLECAIKAGPAEMLNNWYFSADFGN